nr:type II toxin-antitoxin system VapC family toxin [Candidatus Baldrarchaeota archaeon]
MVATKYLDVNIFVYWLGKHPKFGETAYKWIKSVENASRREYVTSSLTIYETLVIVGGLTGRNLRDEKFVEEVITAITSLRGLIIESLTSGDVFQALRLMKEYGFDYEDSLHLAVALRVGAKEIVSNDEDFDKSPLRRIF